MLETEAIALPLGILLAFFLFRTDALGRTLLLGLIILAAFIPLPLHATAWLGAFGNVGRLQLFGWQPILVGRSGAAFVHAMAALPWVVLIAGMGLCAVEPELEESALLDFGPARVLRIVTLRRALAAIAAAALAVAVLTAGDMTVTDLLVIRTYAEESYFQYTLGRGPGDAALVAIPPLCVAGRTDFAGWKVSIARLDPSRIASSFARARVWSLGAWRIPLGLLLCVVRRQRLRTPALWPHLARRQGRRPGDARTPAGVVAPRTRRHPSLRGRRESGEPLLWSLLWTAAAATAATILSLLLGWAARRSRIWNLIAMATLCLTLATPGPVAGMALVLAYRDVAGRVRLAAHDRHGPDVPLVALRDPAPVALLAFIPPGLSRRGRTRRPRPPAAVPASRDPPLTAPDHRRLGDRLRDRPGRAGRNQHRHASHEVRPDAGLRRDLGPASHRRRKPPRRSGA